MKIERLKQILEEIKDEYPDIIVQITTWRSTLEASFHSIKTYAEGTALLRSFGVGKREKSIISNQTVCLSGDAGGLHFQCFIDELPPTCHIEKYKERIPKTQTVESGEFIEVERTRVVCSDDAKAAALVPEPHPGPKTAVARPPEAKTVNP
jgi:hypothetical protein